MVDTRILTSYYLPDSDTRILEAVNYQLTASPSDQDYRLGSVPGELQEVATFLMATRPLHTSTGAVDELSP